MSEDKLVEMIIDAHDAMKSEAMDCPWCSTGYISAHREEHEEHCMWEHIKTMEAYRLVRYPRGTQ